MGIADDIIGRRDQIAVGRAPYERAWRDVIDFTLPYHPRLLASGLGAQSARLDRIVSGGKNASERMTKIYDSTGVWAVDRLAAGIESLVMPQSEKWHGLKIDDVFGPEPTDEEVEWLERMRDVMFSFRYDPRSNFLTAAQKQLRSCMSLGVGVRFIEDTLSTTRRGLDPNRVPISYRYIPLPQCFMATNAEGEVDTNIRNYTWSARQIVQRFGPRASAKVQAAANDPKKADEPFEMIHAVLPREESGSSQAAAGTRGSPWASFYIEADSKHLIGEGGFFEFPFSIMHWQQDDESAYGPSPVMLAMAEIKTLQVMGKAALRGAMQSMDPPLAVSHDGVMNRPDLNPRAVNYNAIDENGRLRIQPILTGGRPDFAETIMEARRGSVRETLYINLFQILLNKPDMSATEALIRANEKGELLGPAGSKIQLSLARDVEREGAILERRGIYLPGSPMAPPASLRGKAWGTKFTSPLDRLRRAQEGIGIQRTVEFGALIAQSTGSARVFDNFDEDEAFRTMAEINGAPRKTLIRVDERDKSRQAQAARQAQISRIGQMKAGSEALQAAGAAVPAMKEIQAGVALGNPGVAAALGQSA